MAQQEFNDFSKLASLIYDKIQFFDDYYSKKIDESELLFEGWHQLTQIYILEYLMNLPKFSQHSQSEQKKLKTKLKDFNEAYIRKY